MFRRAVAEFNARAQQIGDHQWQAATGPYTHYPPVLLASGCHAGRECRRSLSAARQPRLAVTSCEGGHFSTEDDQGHGYHRP